MGMEPQVTCDFCHVIKQQTNHWWMLYHDTWQPGSIILLPFSERKYDQRKHKIACGQECVTKAVGQHMDTETKTVVD